MFARTKIYSVYIKKDSNPLENAIFIKQGFNFWAFIFNIIWALFNRLWLVAIALFALNCVFVTIDSPAMALVSFLVNIWFGFEANNFKAAKLEKLGYINFDVVTGIDPLAAKQRFFDKYLFNKQSSPNI